MRILIFLLPFICFSQNSIFKDSLILINLDENQLVNEIKIEDLESIKLKEDYYFIDDKGGNVFVLKDLKLNQIDNSYRHRMQVGSNIFTYNDTIFRHGGYGFWETRSLLTYYDFSTNEWENLKSKNEGVKKISHLSSTKSGKSIFFGGYQKYPKKGVNNDKSNSVYLFDFTERKWTNLGNSKYHFSTQDIVINVGEYEKLISKNDTLFLINPFINKINFYKVNPILYSTISNRQLSPYYKDSIFYLINKVNPLQKTYKINKRPYEEVLFYKIGEADFIKKNNRYIFLFVLLSFFALCFIIYKYFIKFKSKDKILKLVNDILIYKGRKVKINNYETSILNLLFNNSEIKINSLLNLLGNEKLNYNHQLRIASQTINDLNNKITVFMDLESSFIILSKSDLDKRIKIYKLNDNVRIKIS